MTNIKNFRFTPDSFTEEEKGIMKKHNIYMYPDDIKEGCYHISLLYKRSYSRTHCWNINVAKDALKALSDGMDIDSTEFYNIYNRTIKLPNFEFDYNSVRFHYRSRKGDIPRYYSVSSLGIDERELVFEDEEKYVTYFIPTGEMADGRTSSKTFYKTKEKVKQMAINLLQKQIEDATKFLNDIKEMA